MNPLSELKKQGITLFLAGGSLKFKAQRGITPGQRERIKRDREEIIRLIQQEEAIPTATSEQTDLFKAMLIQIETGRVIPPLWPNVSRYLKKRLPQHLFLALQELIEDQGNDPPRHTKEWLSPFPSRCFDCTGREGCQREEREQWGLLCRHECGECREVKA